MSHVPSGDQPRKPAEVAGADAFDARAIRRPAPVLMTHYTIVAVLSGPAFPIVWLAGFCRYKTLQYRFDDEGLWMSWGVLFKREINLAYRRIQDIHVTRGLIQRWLGLATVSVQTASGAATPEMTIEGVLDADGLRDFLYERMRGAKEHHEPSEDGAPAPDEVLGLLTDIRDGVRALRERVAGLESAVASATRDRSDGGAGR